MVDRFLEFVEREPACFDRSTTEGHVTGSAWLVSPDDSTVLLTHHAKLNAWMQLGGHADGEHDVLKVAMTEAREESGITDIVPVSAEIFDVDIHRIPARKNDGEHFHFDVRYVLRAMHTDHIVSHESHDLAWVDPLKITDFTSERSMLRMAEKWIHHRHLWLK